jgi:hypothetical protein
MRSLCPAGYLGPRGFFFAREALRRVVPGSGFDIVRVNEQDRAFVMRAAARGETDPVELRSRR